MRRLLLAVAMLGTVSAAHAADLSDLPILRGSFTDGLSKRSHNWDGFYVGGQFGFATTDVDFSHAPKTMTDFMLRNSILEAPVGGWSLLPSNHVQSTGFGAYVGRNWQLYDAVFGVEANYSYMKNISSSASDSMTRILDGETAPTGHTYTYVTSLGGGAALKLKDYATFRGRVGWDGGDFMPYAFAGLAIGRAEVSRFATVSYIKHDDYDESIVLGGVTATIHRQDTIDTGTFNKTELRTNSFMYGWTAGIGVEYAICNNILVRGEWEHVGFSDVKDITVGLNNFRVGIGYQF
ncbi:porin family protein [Bradyrhizobium sp. 193]|nr:outer membrane beta-barrel protein [Bradyrhizobium sp. 193]MCK1348045.1 porin family protein [Bradyrhizobium sp. CW11]MCK1471768.1 porin family protein [Bradyrhizobium sp. CW10]MCK1578138.1 porin family protein [Bradyrhizobium sp. 168]MCK1591568.1 porin family protein [Bradyrhizobium sp. 169]MCK1701516.1 porin family protein [Bradyrhizobium sp. 146]UPK15164.1 porin family protein [Bradyrhizobium sp. 155]UPK23022.1 porin family protein [Bradyrhizobium sp. 131]